MPEFKPKHWVVFFVLAMLSLVAWKQFTYPHIDIVNLAINRQEAREIAAQYIRQNGFDPSTYHSAVVFTGARTTDRYLQKTLGGYQEELRFLQKHDLQIFFWKVRFFRELEKEQFFVSIDASTGEITGYHHDILENASRTASTEKEARAKAEAFLHANFYFEPQDYVLTANQARKFDNRTDYSFTWSKKNVAIPWKETGTAAKLLTDVTVAGNEIRYFNKRYLDIPESFKRYVAGLRTVGSTLAILFRIIFFTLLASAVFFVIVRKNDLVMHTTKRFCIVLTAALFGIQLLSLLNGFENLLFSYSTTQSLPGFMGRQLLNWIMDAFIVTIGILMPCLAGESLHYEVLKERKEGSFLHYLASTFWSRSVSRQVIIGYFSAIIMMGLQSCLFEFGQRFLGVWVEHMWLAELSGKYIPAVGALSLALNAAVSEEVSFRLFSISLGKKLFRNIGVAVLVASVIWGYGHSGYDVFPMWFRGLEVSCLGFFLAFIYLRYGILSAITTHFVFDVFWSASAHLMGRSSSTDFWSCLAILLLPLILGAIAFWRNCPATERPLHWQFNPHQVFNLRVLSYFLQQHPKQLQTKAEPDLRQDIINHGWDAIVVERAIAESLASCKPRPEP